MGKSRKAWLWLGVGQLTGKYLRPQLGKYQQANVFKEYNENSHNFKRVFPLFTQLAV
jgi:hypothetical protein